MVIVLSMVLAIGSAMSSFAAGFVSTPQGVKYQWGSGDYCTNNWVNYKSHWFFFLETTSLCVPDGFKEITLGITQLTPVSFRGVL